jgi:hypothetical protein
MKSISERFPPRFYTVAGFDVPQSLTVKNVTEESFNDGERLVLWFKEDKRGYVCRRPAVARRLAQSLGDDPASWTGKKISLGIEIVNGKEWIGAVVDGKFR